MSVISHGKKIQLAPWIHHFEEQARGGASARALTNRHYIVVGSSGGLQGTSCSNLHGVPLPPVVAAVEQSIDQAEEEVKREKVTFEKNKLVKDFGSSAEPVCRKAGAAADFVTKKFKRCRKQRLVPRDIFT